MRQGRAALLVAVACALTGCLSLIEGESVSTEAGALRQAERAVLLGRSAWFLVFAFDMSIWSVDGVLGSGAGERRWEVAPGRHTVEVEKVDMIGGMGGRSHYGFELGMQAGHRYQIQDVHEQRRCVVEIEELLPDQEEGTVLRVPCEKR